MKTFARRRYSVKEKTCRKMRRNPEKPVVGFLLGKIFNKVIGVDVRELEIPGDDRLSHTPF